MPPPRPVPSGKMYWPGYVAPGFDPVVPVAKVRETCKARMDGFDRLSREERDRLNEEGIKR